MNKIKQLEMSLVYIRDTLMATFWDVPIDLFPELRENLLLQFNDRMIVLRRMIESVDGNCLKDAKTYIVDNRDNELAEICCELDLLVWQLIILTSRYDDMDAVIAHIGDVVSEHLKTIYLLKTEIRHKDFFNFDGFEVAGMSQLFERISDTDLCNPSNASKYAGWSKLEQSVGLADGMITHNQAKELNSNFANNGRFEMKIALDDQDIMELYLFLGHFRTSSGPGSNKRCY